MTDYEAFRRWVTSPLAGYCRENPDGSRYDWVAEEQTGNTTEPVAWAVTIGPPSKLSVYEAYAAHQNEEAVAMAEQCRFGDKDKPLPLAPLYFQPTLTDEERAALTLAWMNLSETARRGLQKGHSEEECEPLRAASRTIRELLERLS